MHVVMTGVNHRSAPVEIRERLAFAEKELPGALEALGRCSFIHERLVLSTCNRVEIYATSEDARKGGVALVQFLLEDRGVAERDLEGCLYCHDEPQSVHHLFNVASSLDSMVVGEAQIIAQVKAAYRRDWENGATGKVLNQLFQKALKVGKHVRTATDIARRPVSVGSVAVELAGKIFGDLKGKTTLIVGAGEMSETAAACLASSGVDTVLVANRTFSRAEDIARRFHGRALHLDGFQDELASCDIVITSTGAPHFILRKADMVKAMARRKNRPVFVIDIAVPRNVDPDIDGIDNVYLYNIDDLKKITAENLAGREGEMDKCREIIHAGTEEFMVWLSSIEASPTISSLKRKVEDILHRELTRALVDSRPRSPSTPDEVAWLTRRLAQSLLAEPISRIKAHTSRGNGTLYTSVLHDVFDLDETGAGKVAGTSGVGKAGAGPEGAIALGSRGSALALNQAGWVRDRISGAYPDREVVLKTIRTTGDRLKDVPLERMGGKGVFVKEIEAALLEGEIDIAVHSLKDVPAELPDGLVIGAVTTRAGSADVLVAREAGSLDQLPQGARVGTSSIRRRAYLARYRPDLELVALRGNLDTRLRKLDDGEVDALVVAGAGLRRMGWEERITQSIPFEVMLPAPGQGALALEIRKADRAAAAAVRGLEDEDSRAASDAERGLIAALGGGCRLPVGCLVEVDRDWLKMRAAIISPGGTECIEKTRRCRREDAGKAGCGLAGELLKAGGDRILAQCALAAAGEGR